MDYFDPMTIFNVPKKYMKLMGMWQEKSSSKWYKFYGIVMHLINIDLYLAMQFAYLIIKLEDVKELSDVLSVIFSYIALLLKSLNFMYQLEDIKSLIKTLNELIKYSGADETFKTRSKMIQQTKSVQRVFNLFWFFCILTCIVSGFIPFFQTKVINTKFPNKLWLPFDYSTDSYWYWTLTYYQILNSLIYSGVLVALDVLPVVFMSFAASLVDELALRITKIGNEAICCNTTTKRSIKIIQQKRHEANKEELRRCIESHLKIKEFVGKTGNIFSTMIIIQGLMSSIILCTCAFQLTLMVIINEVSLFLWLFFYMISMVLEIFLPCYYGSKIMISSEQLSTSLFSSNWIPECKEYLIAMKMFMENVKKPLEIKALQFVPVELGTFAKICNSAFSLFAVFQRVNN
ncbi:unnamed protein product [Diamesa serratosioi]